MLVGGVAGYILWRRRQMQREAELGPDLAPRQFRDTAQSGGQVLSINSFMSQGSPHTPKSPQPSSDATSPPIHYTGVATYDPYSEAGTTTATATIVSASNRQSHGNTERPGFANFPSTSVRRSNKAIEAGYGRGSEYPPTTPASEGSTSLERNNSTVPMSSTRSTSSSQWPARSMSTRAPGLDPVSTDDGELVFQHRDAGLPRELPPPYADRTGPGAPPR